MVTHNLVNRERNIHNLVNRERNILLNFVTNELFKLLLVTDGRELREARIHHLSTQGDHKRSGFDALLTHNLQENRRKRSREGTGIIDVEGR